MENKLPAEIETIAKNVSLEKRNEVQLVLNSVFEGVAKMREQLDLIIVENENDNTNMKLSGSVRLAVKNKRLESEKIFDLKRNEVQQEMLSFKTEDSLWLKAKQTMQILTKEIEENAKWKEETSKRFLAEKLDLEIKTRLSKIEKFSQEVTYSQVAGMSEGVFEIFLSGLEKSFNDKIELDRLENERVENERIAKEKEIEATRLENIELKRIADEKENALKLEREANEKKAQAEQKERERLANIENDKLVKIKAENDAKLKAANDARLKIEKELQDKKDAELKTENERKAKELADQKEAEKLAKSPIKKQLLFFVDCFQSPIDTIENETSILILEKFESFKKWAKSEIEKI